MRSRTFSLKNTVFRRAWHLFGIDFGYIANLAPSRACRSASPRSSPVQPVTPSARLLVACAAGAPLEPFAAEAIDWPEFLALAERHGMRPIAHRALEASALPVPGAVARALWVASVERERCNRVLSLELVRVASALEGGGVPCIPFKGPALSLVAYGDASVREFGDLDILVRPRDVPAARRILGALGYRSEYAIPGHAERALLAAHKHYDVVLRGAAGNVVELHWKTDPDFPVEQDDAGWWSTRPRLDFGAAALRAFEPSELMLVLLLHAAKHHWTSLQWLADVAALARREPIDWAWIAERSAALHCRRRVALGVWLMRGVLNASVPGIEGDYPPGIAALAADMYREAFEPEREPPAWELLARNFALYDRKRDGLRQGLEAVFSPTFADWMRWRLPGALSFLYFPLRLARLTGKYALAALRRPRPRSRIGATLRTPQPPPHSRG